MKKFEIETAIEKIKDNEFDPETAHGLEDELREHFIEYIAQREDFLGVKARLVLSTNDLDFARWYA